MTNEAAERLRAEHRDSFDYPRPDAPPTPLTLLDLIEAAGDEYAARKGPVMPAMERLQREAKRALAAERAIGATIGYKTGEADGRRATVERMTARVTHDPVLMSNLLVLDRVRAILDEEAAR